MQNKQQKIVTQINKLITTIHKNADEEFITEIKTFSNRVLSSTMTRTYIEDTSTLKDKIIAKVQRIYDSKSVLSCQNACNGFINSNTVSKKGEVLKMLLKLSQSNEQYSQSFQGLLNENMSSKKPIQSNLNQTQPSFNNTALNQTNKPSFLTQQLNIIRYRGSLEQGISEAGLLKQVIYCFQNISTDLILTDNKGFSALRPEINVSDTTKRIIRQLSEIGWLFKKITQQFNDEGAITKALNLFVKQQMSEYFRWLAIIQNMNKNEQLTLRKLILWSYQPFQTLKWIAIILQAVRPFEGCQIISVINSYRPQGSTSINKLLTRLLQHLLQPLFQYIYNWVYRGQLVDPRNQFFIKEVQQKNQKDWSDWNDKFSLQQHNIPNVLDYESALIIFNAGKTLYFLKNHCASDYHIDTKFPNPIKSESEQLHESTRILSPDFRHWLHTVSHQLNNELVKVLIGTFELEKHLNVMKMFFLTGKGNFIQNLMELLKGELSQQKHLVNNANVEQAISTSVHENFTDKKFIQEITDKLYPELINISEVGAVGWDVFNLKYYVEDPINTVLTNGVMSNYQKIFHFLWKVKRIQQSLKSTWMSSMKDYPHATKFVIIHECNLIRHSMTHFLNNLYSYLMISIESVWNNFSEKIKETSSFDEILNNHEKLIKQILQITLNTTKSKTISDYLNKIFKVIMTFTTIEQRLAEKFSDFHEEYRVYENRKNLIRKGLAYDEQLEMPIFNADSLPSQVKKTRDLYENEFKRFYEHIKKDSDNRINNLCFRLDFSGFYTQIEYKI